MPWSLSDRFGGGNNAAVLRTSPKRFAGRPLNTSNRDRSQKNNRPLDMEPVVVLTATGIEPVTPTV